MSFNEEYLNIKLLIKPELGKLEELLCYVNSDSEELNESLITLMTSSAKRLRPLISFLYLKASNNDIDDNQIIVQTAVELIHNATLIHDDIIDNSSLRRNSQTLNSKFDNSLAVIAGDFLLSIALKKLLSLENHKILTIFASTIEKMCQGEISQYFSKFEMISIDEYIKKSAEKTASLFEASLLSSAILAELDLDKARNFALNFGIAFQIRDDILNFSQNKDKPFKNDFDNGIYTAPIIYAKDINNISDGIEKSFILLDNYLSKARNIILEFDDNIYKKALLEILDLIKKCN